MEGLEKYLRTEFLFNNKLVASVSKALLVNNLVSNVTMGSSQERIAYMAADGSKQSSEAKAEAIKYRVTGNFQRKRLMVPS